MHVWPVLYFYSGVKDFTAEDSGIFVRYDELAGTVKGDTGIEGLKIDFNAGVRVAVPAGDWQVRITDADSGQVFFDGQASETDRVNMLAYADFFIGLSSGLSWLAHAAGCPVVMVSGITLPHSEFDTPYRVQNRQVCHGCYNDLRVDWREDKCPYHKGTAREYECSKKITPQMVIGTIERFCKDMRGKQE